MPADRDLNFGVAGENSTSAADAIANFPVNLTTDETYVVMAAGVVGNMGATAFNLFVNPTAREAAADPANVDVAVFHGSPDAPAVDVYELLTDGKLISNLAFGSYTNYLSLPAAVYDLKVEEANSVTSFLTAFRADLSGLAGGAATVFASGFYSGASPAFGLFAALPDGTVLALGQTPYARVQIIHDSPTPTVDIYTNSRLVADDFEFTDVLGFTELPAGREINVGVAGANSTSAADALANFQYTLDAGGTYVIVAAGVLDSVGAKAFNLFVKADAQELSGTADDVAVQVFHGSPDAPAVDVVLPDGTVLFDNISFGNFSDYVTVPSDVYEIRLTPADDNSTIIQSYRLDLVDDPGQALIWKGRATTVFATGYIGGSVPAFSLYATQPSRSIPLQQITSTQNLATLVSGFQLFPNPNGGDFNLSFNLEQETRIRYRVVSATGKMVSEGDFDNLPAGSFNQRIVNGTLPAGLYHLELVSDKGNMSVRFVVNR
ncbi:MAG: DUF4397 domain-containing protein [Lewinellaceae bacterium]|nr:DUF4397 domain-containing protein [Lewinellaceae bacterium]